MRTPSLILVLCSLFALASPTAAADDRFFLRAGAGASFPFLKNLNNELSLQGNAKVNPGYSLGISLGRTFAEMQWSLEAHFSTAFYPDFNYKNTSDSFVGKLRHYDYMGVLKRHLRPEGKAFRPTLGAGIGYGLTHLVTGSGKLAAAEALVMVTVGLSSRENIDISVECSCYAGLQRKKFENPFLQNFDTDVVKDSTGNPLGDRFNSLDIRIGITVWLKHGMPQ